MSVAIIDLYQEFQFEIIERLNSEGIKISYAITGVEENFHGDKNKIKAVLLNLSEKTTIINVKDLIFSEEILKLGKLPFLLSRDILLEYKDIELDFLKLTDRSTAFPTSIDSRRKYYYLILNYFLTIIDEKRFEFAVSFDTPHSFSSNLFYQILIKKGIKVIRIEYHYFMDYCVVLDNTTFPLVPQSFLKGISISSLEKRISPQLLNQLYNSNSFVEAYVSKEQKRLSKTGLKGHLKIVISYTFKWIANLIMGLFPLLFKKHVRHFTSLNSIHYELKYRLAINKNLIDQYILLKRYRKISILPDLGEKYIYFGMHMQPEKTTMPLGESYDHQLNAILTLSQALPKGWKLYVKEHPNQFNKRKAVNIHYRDEGFYKVLLSKNNIELIDLNVSSEKLIKHSQIVSTITGTLGWEALQNSKPVIVFGDAYYKGCGAVGIVQSVPQCNLLINKLQKLTPVMIKECLLKYLIYYEENEFLIHSSNWQSKFEMSDVPRETKIQNLTHAILTKLS